MDKIDQWHLKRRGRFTASEDYKLLVSGKKGEMFGDGAITYIEMKAIEMTTRMWERPELEESKSILHGKAHEYPAIEEYVRVTRNTAMIYFGEDNPIFYPYEPLAEEAGGSPDCGIINVSVNGHGKIELGSEFKCPKNPSNHFHRLKWKDQYDIKDNYILCYTQIQKLLMCTGASEWHFVSYDDRQIVRSKKIKIIEVKPDRKFQDNLEIRLRQAIKEKYRLISEHYEIEVKNRTEFIQKFNLAA
jgi:hypothetical protein